MNSKQTNETPPHRDHDPLGLTQLPQLEPVRDGWAAVQFRLKAGGPETGNQPANRPFRPWSMALAASVAAGLILIVTLSLSPHVGDRAATTADSAGALFSSAEKLTDQTPSLAQLQARSQLLQQAIRASRERNPAISGEAAIYAVELEDLIAQMDHALSEKPQSRTLWRSRVELMGDLLAVYQLDDADKAGMAI